MKRRKFLKVASLGSAALASPFYASSLTQDKKLKVGLIGSGWYGMVIARAALTVGGVEIIGVCDVDSQHLAESVAELEKLQGRKPESFKDYGELLNMKGLEAVFIGTPPHWHALQFIAACEKGLDIYCEKPLAYDIKEGIAMVNAAEKAGNIVQVGFQRRQSEAFKKAKSIIENGTIGKVHQVTAQIHYNPVLLDTSIQTPPASLDWEEWCGPAPKLDYRPNIGHKAWRLEKEYGNGHLVDWGIHHIDICRKIMNEDMPEEIYSRGGNFEFEGKITTPDTLTSGMAFRNAPLTWQHRLWGNGDMNPEFNNGIFFHGDKGTMFAGDSKLTLLLAGKDNKKEEMSIPTPQMQEKHMENFLNAVKLRDRNRIACKPSDAFMSTATVQLAMISYYTGKAVKWDKSQMTIIENPEAERMLGRDYRGKYKHP
jgi:predicted dehydrogenase